MTYNSFILLINTIALQLSWSKKTKVLHFTFLDYMCCGSLWNTFTMTALRAVGHSNKIQLIDCCKANAKIRVNIVTQPEWAQGSRWKEWVLHRQVHRQVHWPDFGKGVTFGGWKGWERHFRGEGQVSKAEVGLRMRGCQCREGKQKSFAVTS